MYSYTKGASEADFKTNFPLVASNCIPIQVKRIADNGEIETGLLIEFDAQLITAQNLKDLSQWILITEFFDSAEEYVAFRDKNGIFNEIN